MERSNRIILILTGVLLLLVFMDLQAERHQSDLTGSRSSIEEMPAMHPVHEPQSPFDPYLEPVRDRAENILGRGSSFQTADNRSELASENNGTGNVETSVDPEFAHLSEEELADIYLTPEISISGPLNLYFIRFRSGNSELVRVDRHVEVHDLKSVVELLQKGPLLSERGLLNAFTERIEIRNIRLEDGIAIVDVAESITHNNAAVVQDRIDQLTATLIQFPEVRGVYLLIEGRYHPRPVEHIYIPSLLAMPERRILDFQS